MYVELKNINKTFGDYKASDNVNFGIEKGRLIGLLGPSGSGKTTILLRLTIIQSSRPLMLSIMLTVQLSVPNL